MDTFPLALGSNEWYACCSSNGWAFLPRVWCIVWQTSPWWQLLVVRIKTGKVWLLVYASACCRSNANDRGYGRAWQYTMGNSLTRSPFAYPVRNYLMKEMPGLCAGTHATAP